MSKLTLEQKNRLFTRLYNKFVFERLHNIWFDTVFVIKEPEWAQACLMLGLDRKETIELFLSKHQDQIKTYINNFKDFLAKHEPTNN